MTGPAVRRYAASDREAWNELVARARAPHFFFDRGYMEYHADRFEDLSLVLHEGGRLVAALPASRDGETAVSHGGLTFGGVIASDGMTTNGMLRAFAAIAEHLRAAGCSRWVYKPLPHIYHRVPSEEDLYAVFRNDGRLFRRDVASVVAADGRRRYRKGRRASLSRAGGERIEVERERDVRPFMALEAEALQRRHGVAPTHTPGEMQMLADRFPDNIELFTARRDGQLLAGVLVYETPRVAHAQYIAGSDDGLRLGAVDLVVDHLLSERFAGKPYFDFGISTEDDGRHLNVGLVRNKESFGATAVAYDQYVIEL